MSHQLQVRVYESLDSLESLRRDWEELLAAFPTATTFSTAEWLVPWWRAFGGGQRLKVLGFFDGGQLVALAPLSLVTKRVTTGLRLRVLRLMGDGSDDSDNLDLPVRSGYEKALAAALLDYLRETSKCWDICHLNTLPSHSPAGMALRDLLEENAWRFYVYSRAWCVAELPQSWEEYLQKLTTKERGKIGYYSRRLEKKYTVRFHRVTEERELPVRLEALFRLHHKRWQLAGQPGSFGSAARRQCYAEISREFLARGWLEFWLLELDAQPVAAQFGFRYGDTVFALQEGFDPAYSLDSVGYVLRAYVLKQLIGQGVRRYDFLAGESEVKTRWGAEVGQYLDIHFAAPRTLGAVYLGSLHLTGQAKEALRRRLPPGVSSALHRLNVRLRDAAHREEQDLGVRDSQST